MILEMFRLRFLALFTRFWCSVMPTVFLRDFTFIRVFSFFLLEQLSCGSVNVYSLFSGHIIIPHSLHLYALTPFGK